MTSGWDGFKYEEMVNLGGRMVTSLVAKFIPKSHI